MPILTDYAQFHGRHWKTGSVANHLAYQGFTAPHTNEPYSEAFLLGVSGGVAFGYFTFHYEGQDPQCNLLTRNTFDPLDTMLSRLGIVQTVQRTGKPDTAVANLVDALESGVPPLVWADAYSLPYNGLSPDSGMWQMWPVVVYGYDPAQDVVHVADRAAVPLHISPADLHEARARVKKDKFQLLTLSPPQTEKLAPAVTAGIWDTINLYTEKPPKGSKNNFGLSAYQFWAKMLTNEKQKRSWAKLFPLGSGLYAGVTFAYHMAFQFGKGVRSRADRVLYADFLEEAAVLLERPALRDAADSFRTAGEAWLALGQALLPDEIVPFGQARQLMDKQHALLIEQGGSSLSERQAIGADLAGLRAQVADDFPLDEAGVVSFRAQLAEAVLAVHEAENTAVETLRTAML
jgi:hypothetical protein